MKMKLQIEILLLSYLKMILSHLKLKNSSKKDGKSGIITSSPYQRRLWENLENG